MACSVLLSTSFLSSSHITPQSKKCVSNQAGNFQVAFSLTKVILQNHLSKPPYWMKTRYDHYFIWGPQEMHIWFPSPAPRTAPCILLRIRIPAPSTMVKLRFTPSRLPSWITVGHDTQWQLTGMLTAWLWQLVTVDRYSYSLVAQLSVCQCTLASKWQLYIGNSGKGCTVIRL